MAGIVISCDTMQEMKRIAKELRESYGAVIPLRRCANWLAT